MYDKRYLFAMLVCKYYDIRWRASWEINFEIQRKLTAYNDSSGIIILGIPKKQQSTLCDLKKEQVSIDLNETCPHLQTYVLLF